MTARASADLATHEPPRPLTSPASFETGKAPFTHYLHQLASGAEPSKEAFDELWRALRGAVIAELRRRCAWTLPPSYFGVYGWESWQAWEPGPGRTASALEELLTDCYTFVFLERRRRLRAQLAVKPNVEGLVILYLRNYLHERRRRHDLLGFRVFESLRAAILQALEAGELWLLAGDSRVVNATVLATTREADTADLAGAEILAPIVESWDVLPDLVVAGGTRRRRVVEQIRRLVLRLEAEGVRCFRFKDLVDTVKSDVRARWAAIFDLEEGETALEEAQGFATVARLVRPERRVEAQDAFDKLVACVAGLVDGLAEPERTRHYLRTLWGFLRAWASGETADSLPSARLLGELLFIPRKRLPDLWMSLRELVKQCQSSLDGRPRERDGSEAAP